eukprot:TRINITY_DN1606_c1_g2_i1.p1 TRINITY_DN1606_c1_g2~~TRINITY_DN1606_c1_g2_i1.p1  ORF type:complete len:1043 (+),score=314.17 TRINITY_DN1606_c1_g2_i1:93-3221(+)
MPVPSPFAPPAAGPPALLPPPQRPQMHGVHLIRIPSPPPPPPGHPGPLMPGIVLGGPPSPCAHPPERHEVSPPRSLPSPEARAAAAAGHIADLRGQCALLRERCMLLEQQLARTHQDQVLPLQKRVAELADALAECSSAAQAAQADANRAAELEAELGPLREELRRLRLQDYIALRRDRQQQEEEQMATQRKEERALNRSRRRMRGPRSERSTSGATLHSQSGAMRRHSGHDGRSVSDGDAADQTHLSVGRCTDLAPRTPAGPQPPVPTSCPGTPVRYPVGTDAGAGNSFAGGATQTWHSGTVSFEDARPQERRRGRSRTHGPLSGEGTRLRSALQKVSSGRAHTAPTDHQGGQGAGEGDIVRQRAMIDSVQALAAREDRSNGSEEEEEDEEDEENEEGGERSAGDILRLTMPVGAGGLPQYLTEPPPDADQEEVEWRAALRRAFNQGASEAEELDTRVRSLQEQQDIADARCAQLAAESEEKSGQLEALRAELAEAAALRDDLAKQRGDQAEHVRLVLLLAKQLTATQEQQARDDDEGLGPAGRTRRSSIAEAAASAAELADTSAPQCSLGEARERLESAVSALQCSWMERWAALQTELGDLCEIEKERDTLQRTLASERHERKQQAAADERTRRQLESKLAATDEALAAQSRTSRELDNALREMQSLLQDTAQDGVLLRQRLKELSTGKASAEAALVDARGSAQERCDQMAAAHHEERARLELERDRLHDQLRALAADSERLCHRCNELEMLRAQQQMLREHAEARLVLAQQQHDAASEAREEELTSEQQRALLARKEAEATAEELRVSRETELALRGRLKELQQREGSNDAALQRLRGEATAARAELERARRDAEQLLAAERRARDIGVAGAQQVAAAEAAAAGERQFRLQTEAELGRVADMLAAAEGEIHRLMHEAGAALAVAEGDGEARAQLRAAERERSAACDEVLRLRAELAAAVRRCAAADARHSTEEARAVRAEADAARLAAEIRRMQEGACAQPQQLQLQALQPQQSPSCSASIPEARLSPLRGRQSPAASD